MKGSRADRSLEMTESNQFELRTFDSNARLATVADIARALSANLTLEKLLELIMERLTRALDAERSTLFLWTDEHSGVLWSKVALGSDVHEIRIRPGQGIAGWVASTGRGVNIKDVYQDSRFDPHWDVENHFRTTSMLCQPIFHRDGDLIGVVQVLNKKHGYFSVDDEGLLSTINALAAMSIVNNRLNNQLAVHNVSLTDTQRQLAERVSEIDLLYRLEQEAGAASDSDELLRALVDQIAAAVPTTVAELALVTESGSMLILRSRRGEPLQLLNFAEPVGLAGKVIDHGQLFNINEVQASLVSAMAAAEHLPFTPDAGLVLPLLVDGAAIGAIAVYEKPQKSAQLTEDDAKLLTLVSGQVTRAIVQRRAREAAAHEDRLSAVGSALAGVMHDFRTPMTIASAYVQMLKQEDDASEREILANDVLKQLDRMLQMTREVLSFARGEQTVFIRRIMVPEFAREAETLIQQIFASTRVKTQVDCPFRGAAHFDHIKLLRVVQNVARNARDALTHTHDGKFTLRIYAEDDDLILEFADNGHGVPDAFRHKLFATFATQGKADGTGLGLAMVKQFAEAHGGTVLYRDTEGGGATFVIRLAQNPELREQQDKTEPVPPPQIEVAALPPPTPKDPIWGR